MPEARAHGLRSLPDAARPSLQCYARSPRGVMWIRCWGSSNPARTLSTQPRMRHHGQRWSSSFSRRPGIRFYPSRGSLSVGRRKGACHRLSALSNSNPSLLPRLRASGSSFLTIASDPFETSHPWFRRPSTGSHSFRLRNYPKGLPATTPFLTSKSFKCNLLTDLVGTVWHS